MGLWAVTKRSLFFFSTVINSDRKREKIALIDTRNRLQHNIQEKYCIMSPYTRKSAWACRLALVLGLLLLFFAKETNANESWVEKDGPSVLGNGNLRSSNNADLSSKSEKIPSWEEIDALPLAPWYDEAKFGIFLHWSAFSVPALCSEWFEEYWRSESGPCGAKLAEIVNATERPGFSYQEYASRFKAELYNATDWSKLFAEAGAQYVVLTSKHHDGYCMWDSSDVPTTWQWNVMDVGPRRDLLGELASAVRAVNSPQTSRKLKFGVYHSMYEWFNPLYMKDRENKFQTNDFVTMKTLAELRDLTLKYQPEVIWSDGDWEAPSDYWQSREFLKWYSERVPTGVWNDRFGNDSLCKHGSFFTCADHYVPGHLVTKKWENAMPIDKGSWGYNRMASLEEYLSTKELIHSLIETVAFNGNLLLNVGPSADGTISPIFADRLMGIGRWLSVNGAAIYQTQPWKVCQKEEAFGVYYTRADERLYAHITKWPSGSKLSLKCLEVNGQKEMKMLGTSKPVKFEVSPGNGTLVHLPQLTPDVIPCEHAWVLEVISVSLNANLKTNGSARTEEKEQ